MELKRLPFVTLSYAQSLDGSISKRDGSRLYLSGKESLKMTHRLRASNQAILVGIGTVLSDNPSLTVRLVKGKNPQTVIVDSQLRIPIQSKLFSNEKKPWVITSVDAPSGKENALIKTGAEIIRCPAKNGKLDLEKMLILLKNRGIQSILIEGGAGIITSVIEENLADRIVITIAPVYFGGKSASVHELSEKQADIVYKKNYRLGKDLIIEAEPLNKPDNY